jgi:membrane protease YdiL (CAAX protease family)
MMIQNSLKETFMEINLASAQTRPEKAARPFSLAIYLTLVFALSWPFQIAFTVWGEGSFWSYLLSSLSMVMVSVASYIAGRFVFRDGFSGAGWSWGKPRQYAWTFALALLIFAVPAALELLLGLNSIPANFAIGAALGSFVLHFVMTLIPGFGEEFGWRGYMLPRLARRYSARKALLVHALIWWAWHLPVVIAIGVEQGLGSSPAASVAIVILLTLVPSMMNAVIFGYVWASTGSLAVSSAYHAAYDEVRDVIEKSIGFGPLVSLWEMAVTTLLGAYLLWKGNWRRLEAERESPPAKA